MLHLHTCCEIQNATLKFQKLSGKNLEELVVDARMHQSNIFKAVKEQ